MGLTRDQPGVNMGSTCGQHGVNTTSTWGQPAPPYLGGVVGLVPLFEDLAQSRVVDLDPVQALARLGVAS